MTENTPGAAGNLPEQAPAPAEPAEPVPPAATPPPADSPADQQSVVSSSAAAYLSATPADAAALGQPTPAPAAQPSPWSSVGYQQQSGYQHYGVGQPPPGGADVGRPLSGAEPAAPESGTFEYPPLDPAPPQATAPEQPTVSYPTSGAIGYSTEAVAGYPSYPPPGTLRSTEEIRARRRRVASIIGIVVLVVVIGGAAGGLGAYLFGGNNASGPVVSSLDQPVPGATQAANAPAGSVQAVAAQVLPTVVEISVQVQSSQGMSGDTGSGIIISSDGQILTNNHVVADAAGGAGQIQVIFSNGRTVNATILGRDPNSDIAVIKAQGVSGLPVAQLGTAQNLQVGQAVVAIGAPYGLSGTVTSGIISSLHRPTVASDGQQNSQETVMDAIQTDAPINPGNSGGALTNMQGQVIGINSAIYSDSSGSGGQGGNVGIGFAIPIDQARRLANDIVTTGHSIQTVLGVTVVDNVEGIPASQEGQVSAEQQAEQEQAGLTNGALIESVSNGGPAAKGGLRVGTVVTKVDGRLINSANGLVASVHAAAPGDQMTLTLSDNSTVTVTLSGESVQAR